MSVRYKDSIYKIFYYLENLKGCKKISNMLFRSYTCPEKCGACCPKFSLDYFENTKRLNDLKLLYPEQYLRLKKRTVSYNNIQTVVYSDFQEDNEGFFCRNLDTKYGRCKIHKANPFTCSFELNKIPANKIIIKKLFSRKWNMTKIDGSKGTKCEMVGYDLKTAQSDLNLFKELKSIASIFKLNFNIIDSLLIKINEVINGFKSFEKK